MYYPLYNNPFYYPYGAYIPNNMCSVRHIDESLSSNNTNNPIKSCDNSAERNDKTNNEINTSEGHPGDLFSINGDRLEVFGISINIDDLIILIMLFFLLRENQVDYSIIIILALILFDQS